MSNTGLLLFIKAVAKKTVYGAAIVAFFEYIGVDLSYVVLLSFVMSIDMLTGIFKGVVTKQYKSTSEILNGLIKRLSVLLLIMSIGAASSLNDNALQGLVDWFMSIASTAFMIVQLHSIVGNLYIMWYNKDMKDQEATAMLLKFIKDKLLYGLTSYLKNENKKGK